MEKAVGTISDTCSIRKQLEEALSKEINPDEEVLIYGAGDTAKINYECFKFENINIIGYVDNDPNKTGTLLNGKEVISVDEMVKSHKDKTILICTNNALIYPEIKNNLDSLGMSSLSAHTFVYVKNREKVLKVYDMLCDDISKATYANMIMARMGEELDLSLVFENQYFAINEFAQFSASEVFVDCGAYVGDTVEQYLFKKQGVFGKIYAFEPDERNFAAMGYRMERLRKEWAISDERISLIHAGVGETTETLYVSGAAVGSASLGASISQTDTGSSVKIYSIDDYFKEQRISFLKADIESYEEKMLLGAKKVIRRDRPKIAICIYHSVCDMFRIPLLLSEIYSGYRFSVRQHYGNLTETVLYAY